MATSPAQGEPQGAPGPPAGGAAAGASPSSAAAQHSKPQAGGGAAAADPPPPPQELPEGGSPLMPEPLLPGSSEEEGGRTGEPPAAAMSTEEAAQRKRRREHWEREQEGKRRWDLARRLSDISTDVEFLAREVERVRSEMEVPLPSLNDLPEGERLQLEAMRRRRLTDLLANHCKKALGHITSHKWSWPFQAPVDVNQYPDYALAITNPMDFGTIKRRIDAGLTSGGYRHPDEFLSDVRLVFDNARLYNKPGSDVHVMANTLQERFEERYSAGVAPRVLEESAVTVAQREEVRRRHQEASGKDSGEALEQHCAVLIKYIDEVSACILDARSAAAALCKPVSREEKEALVRALTAMPQEQFEAAMGLVLAHHPGLQACDDFGFDLDALDALSLRQMQSFVRACDAAEAEAKQQGRPGPGASVGWPQLLLGAGLRPYRPPRGSKRLRRLSAGGVFTPAAAAGLQQQQQRQLQQQEAVRVKREPQVHAWQQPPPVHLPGQPVQPAGGIRTGKGSRRPVAEMMPDFGHLPSTLTPEEVAAAALAAAGMLAPMLPPAGSAVASKPLGPAASAGAAAAATPPPAPSPPPAAAAPPPPAAAPQRQQQAQQGKQVAAAVVVGSNKPVPPLGLPTGGPAAAAKATSPVGGAPAALGPRPTPAQMAAVASATAEQHKFLSQMHGLLSQAHKTQTAAAQGSTAKTPGQQAQQPKQQQQPSSKT